MNTSLNESTARDWLETHATTDVAGIDDDPERIDELARYERWSS